MTEAPKKKMSKGCMIGLVSMGVVLILTVLTIMYAPGYLHEKMITELADLELKINEANLENYDSEQIEEIFAEAIIALDSGTVSKDVMENVMQSFTAAYSHDSLTQEDAIKILQALQMMNPNFSPPDSTDATQMDGSATTGAGLDADSIVGNAGGGE